MKAANQITEEWRNCRRPRLCSSFLAFFGSSICGISSPRPVDPEAAVDFAPHHLGQQRSVFEWTQRSKARGYGKVTTARQRLKPVSPFKCGSDGLLTPQQTHRLC